MKEKSKETSSLFDKLNLLLSGVKNKSFFSLIILVFQGLTEGVGLLLIIPLLSVAGVSNADNSNGQMTQAFQSFSKITNTSITITNVLIFYVIIMSFYAFLKFTQAIITAQINQKVVVYWRNQFFERLSYSSWSSISKLKHSDIQNALSIEIRKFGAISNQLIQLTGSSILIIIYLIISATLSLKLTLIALIPIGIIALINKPINKKTSLLGKSTVIGNKEIQSIILEQLSALKLVKSYQKEKQHLDEFRSTNEELESKTINFIKETQKTKVIFELFAAVFIAIYIYIAISVFKAEITELLLLIFIFSRMLPKASKLANNYQQILNNIPAMESTQDLLRAIETEKMPHHTPSPKVLLENTITFKDVSFSYPKKPVLNKLNFKLNANKTTIITGPSGKGKSTCIDLILGLQKPVDGTIFIDDTPMQSINQVHWRSLIAYVPQEAFLFHKSIRDNLSWANEFASEKELWNCLEKANAKEFVKGLPDGLDTVVGNRGNNLSGGQRQRIALARAIIRNPKLLILDEATNAVDDESETLIKEALSKLNGEITIVIVAHRSSLIDLADYIVEL